MKQELPSLTGDLAKAWRYGIGTIDSGETRWILAGPSVDQFTATIELLVLTNTDSLEAAVARQRRVDATFFPANVTRTEVNLVLPIGPAVRQTIVFEPVGGAPTGDVDYYLRLDGSTLLLAGSAPANDGTFLDLMGRLAQSLRRG